MSGILDNMVDILSQEIGSITARASIVMFAERMGIKKDSIGPEHVGELVKQLKPGLFVFVGEKKTEDLAKEMLNLERA